MDIVTPDQRSLMMSRIRGRDTGPELVVRRLAHRLGFRYRLHRRDLPGSPDMVFVRRRKVVFVHGCFWHRHMGCRMAYQPKSNVPFWMGKFARNVERDREVVAQLQEAGWKVLTVWECETAKLAPLEERLQEFLG